MMKLPVIEGVIDRRILINYTVDPEVLARYLPKPFRPKMVHDRGVAGICLIRLKNIRARGLPEMLGINSENAAHRIAVEWTEAEKTKEGVYIPRRDTNSVFNHWAGGNLFPGIHHLAKFDVREHADSYELDIESEDGTAISISAKPTMVFPSSSVFENLDTASSFFRKGSLGFSPNKKDYDGLELKTEQWKVMPLQVDRVNSSFFNNETLFPKGSVVFDNALLMKDIRHTWHSVENCLCP
jgi:hypothetical protein